MIKSITGHFKCFVQMTLQVAASGVSPSAGQGVSPNGGGHHDKREDLFDPCHFPSPQAARGHGGSRAGGPQKPPRCREGQF